MKKSLVKGFVTLLFGLVLVNMHVLTVEAALDEPDDYFETLLNSIGSKKFKNYQFAGRNVIGYNTNMDNFKAYTTGVPTNTIQEGGLYVGTSTLRNDTSIQQVLKTNTFSKQYANKVATQTTIGFAMSSEVSAKFEVPFVGETGVKLTASFNASNSNVNETSETTTYTVDAQGITVPANTTYFVRVYLQTGITSGTIEYTANPKEINPVDGVFYYDNNWKEAPFKYTWKTLTKEASQLNILPKNISFDKQGNPILIGYGTYSAQYGTNFVVEVYEKTVDKNVSSRFRSDNQNRERLVTSYTVAAQ